MQLLSMHNTAEHDAAPPAPPIPPSAARKAKADRPSIDMGVTTERWVYFQKRWNTYKISTGIAGADIQGQLMDTCSEQLRYVTFQDNNDIEQQPELHILDYIRRLAVKAENVMVSRVVLNNLQQQADEGIRNFELLPGSKVRRICANSPNNAPVQTLSGTPTRWYVT